jgi:hypothetical protein
MGKYLAALAAAIVVAASGLTSAAAGVVLTENEMVLSGAIGSIPPMRTHTVMIQGNKQKLVAAGGHEIIIDLDKNKMQIVDTTQKTYIDMSFPPPGVMAQALGGPGLHTTDFSKTGTERTILNYKCVDYKGAGKFPIGTFSVVYCASTTAPGAAEFTKFQKAMLAKLKNSELSLPNNAPDGIPLVQDTITKMDVANLHNVSPRAAEQLKKRLADRPAMVTKTEVTSVAEQNISAKEFEIPAGYTLTPMAPRPAMGATGGHAMGGGAGANGGHAPAAGASPATKKP